MSTPLRVIPLGGLGEIGRNMMVYEYDEDIIIVDVGLMFPEEEMLGVDLVIPDITYVMEHAEHVKGVFLTHGHEDHIGALPFLLRELNVPVFCTRLTRGLVDVKLKEHRLQNDAIVQTVEVGSIIDVGAFRVEFFAVSHSIPDAAGLIIHTPHGQVVHTGDFKIDHTPVMGQHTDLQRLAEVGREGALLLAMDSTYVEIEGYTPSEQTVADALDRVIGSAPDRVIVTTFASLISRVQIVLDAAEKYGRRVFVTGRSMVNNVQMAREMGYLRVPNGVLMTANEMTNHPTAKTIVICTGSQGEPTSALTRMANGTHQNITIHPNDTVVLSSNPIPGNEMLVYKNVDNLFRAGARVIYNRLDSVHVRGHAAREELKIMHRIVQPKHFIGIHGEYRHLVLHRQLAISLGTPEDDALTLVDGDIMEIDEDGARIVGKVPAEYVYVDGLGVGDVDHIVLRDRAHLASDGMVVVVVALDRQDGGLLRPVEVMSHGFVGPEEEPEISEGIRSLVTDMVGGEAQRVDWAGIRETLKGEVATYIHQQTRRRPLVLPITVEV
ncbi:MAG: ribonuclease J [Dehalococcoidia bacterium]